LITEVKAGVGPAVLSGPRLKLSGVLAFQRR
jgi:hypothetical protein